MTKPTKDQIENEPAGPRMDAWVAEFVLGTKLPLHNPAGRILEYSGPDGMSTGATWRVVEAMRANRRRSIYLTCYRGIYAAGFSNGQTRPELVEAPTAPLAICRAALICSV